MHTYGNHWFLWLYGLANQALSWALVRVPDWCFFLCGPQYGLNSVAECL